MAIPEPLKPLTWLIGTWKSVKAEVSYPTIQPLNYKEEMVFKTVGQQPLLQYESKTWHPIKGNPMHLESGYLRIEPVNNNLAFMVSHNFGLATVEEGKTDEIGNKLLMMKSTQVSRMSFAKNPPVLAIQREYKLLEDGCLDYTLWMETSSTPLTQHLKVTYERNSG